MSDINLARKQIARGAAMAPRRPVSPGRFYHPGTAHDRERGKKWPVGRGPGAGPNAHMNRQHAGACPGKPAMSCRQANSDPGGPRGHAPQGSQVPFGPPNRKFVTINEFILIIFISDFKIGKVAETEEKFEIDVG